MRNEVISDIIYCLVFTGGFTLLLCIFGGIVEHLIPDRVMDKILEAVFGELPDDYE
jgi:hypothetical protein